MKKVCFIVLATTILFVIGAILMVRMHNSDDSNLREAEQFVDSRIEWLLMYSEDVEFWLTDIISVGGNHTYVFRPGTTREEIESIIGFSDKNIPEVVIEGYTQLLYVEDRGLTPRVITNIHTMKPYRFYIEGSQDKEYVRLSLWARCRFKIEPDGTVKIIIDENLFRSWENMPYIRAGWNTMRIIERRTELYIELIEELYNGDFDRDFWFPDIAAFEWDYAYIFRPGTTKSEIERIIGFENESIPDIVVEGYTQMLFICESFNSGNHNGGVVSIHGVRPYRFYVEGFDNEEYLRITNQARCRLVVEADGSVTIVIFDVYN